MKVTCLTNERVFLTSINTTYSTLASAALLKGRLLEGVILRAEGVLLNAEFVSLKAKGVIIKAEGVILKAEGVILNAEGVIIKAEGVRPILKAKGVIVKAKEHVKFSVYPRLSKTRMTHNY